MRSRRICAKTIPWGLLTPLTSLASIRNTRRRASWTWGASLIYRASKTFQSTRSQLCRKSTRSSCGFSAHGISRLHLTQRLKQIWEIKSLIWRCRISNRRQSLKLWRKNRLHLANNKNLQLRRISRLRVRKRPFRDTIRKSCQLLWEWFHNRQHLRLKKHVASTWVLP